MNLKVMIHGDTWKLYLHEEEDFVKRFGDGLCALCFTETKQIHFNEAEFTLGTVRHEMLHAYYFYSCVNAASLTADQVEEVFCELFAVQGAKILKQASFIYKEMRK